MSNLVGNEQVRLSATYLNGIAVVLFAIGGDAPLASFVSGNSPVAALWLSLLFFVGCATLSAALPYFARTMLRRLEE